MYIPIEKKTAAKAKEIIRSALSADAVRAKSSSKGSRAEIWISWIKNAQVNHKKLKVKSSRNF